jgi:hypothetical protein
MISQRKIPIYRICPYFMPYFWMQMMQIFDGVDTPSPTYVQIEPRYPPSAS